MTSLVLQRIRRFMDIVVHSSLQYYFGISNIQIEVLENENEIFVTTHFNHKSPVYDIQQLPIEISRLIASYNETYIIIKTKIHFGNSYPFDRPIWTLLDVEHNVNGSISLKEYYQYIVDNHNQQYVRYWSPAITIDKDILEFVQKVNHFQYLENETCSFI